MALFFRHLIAALVPLALASASAQSPKPPAPPPQFRIVSMSDVETFLFDINKKKETVYASVGAFSPLYPAPPSRDLLLYKEEPNPDPKLPPTKVPLAKAKLPGDGPGPFLILVHRTAAGAALPYETTVINHSLLDHPANTFRVFNFSKRRLAVNLADQNLILEKGQSDRVPYPNTRKTWLKVAANEDDGNWLLVSSSPHSVGTDSRTTIFLVDIAPSALDQNPKGLIARRIRETIYTDDAGVQHVR